MAVETSVSQSLTALDLRSLLALLVLETAVWEQMTACHMVLQETVLNALVSAHVQYASKKNFPSRPVQQITRFRFTFTFREPFNFCSFFGAHSVFENGRL